MKVGLILWNPLGQGMMSDRVMYGISNISASKDAAHSTVSIKFDYNEQVWPLGEKGEQLEISLNTLFGLLDENGRELTRIAPKGKITTQRVLDELNKNPYLSQHVLGDFIVLKPTENTLTCAVNKRDLDYSKMVCFGFFPDEMPQINSVVSDSAFKESSKQFAKQIGLGKFYFEKLLKQFSLSPQNMAALTPRKSITTNISGDTLLTQTQQDTLLQIARKSLCYSLFYLKGDCDSVDYSDSLSLIFGGPGSSSILCGKLGCFITVNQRQVGKTKNINLAWDVPECVKIAAYHVPNTISDPNNALIQIIVVRENDIDFKINDFSKDIQLKRDGIELYDMEHNTFSHLMPDEVAQIGDADSAVNKLLISSGLNKSDLENNHATISTFVTQTFQETNDRAGTNDSVRKM
jgi:hypothetical protein